MHQIKQNSNQRNQPKKPTPTPRQTAHPTNHITIKKQIQRKKTINTIEQKTAIKKPKHIKKIKTNNKQNGKMITENKVHHFGRQCIYW
jgi:hypothetical protein